MWICAPCEDTYPQNWKLEELEDFLEANQCIDYNWWNLKNGTLATNFHKPAEEAIPYVRFGNGPLTIS